jgi:hypothetical protein
MGRTAEPLREGERVYYTHPLRDISERVEIVLLYWTRTGPRALVLTKAGTELRVRPSQLSRKK